MDDSEDKTLISIIVPIHNGENWINDCFDAIERQDLLIDKSVELSLYNDGSTDGTLALLKQWKDKMDPKFKIIIAGGGDSPQGVGYAKNRAVENSSGEFLCFQDVDDVMMPSRLSQQLAAAKRNRNAIIGCQVTREPADSTLRFTRWANFLPQNLLSVQIYTSHGPTLLMPTWFCSREVFDRVGGFSETGAGTPEDLLFFYRHLDVGGDLHRVEKQLVMYRFHSNATTHSISEETIWEIRLKRLEEKVLSYWENFTIWNAGKQGKRFWRDLTQRSKQKVVSFCDVDKKKIGRFYEPYQSEIVKIPIHHFSECKPPFVICVKLDLTHGNFEKNLNSMHLTEGVDYVMFS